jgi:hypothetical protein
MLSEDDLEAMLRRYRVGDPPSDLGSAVVAASVEGPRRFERIWGPAAAAAVLASWVAFHLGMTEPTIDRVRAQEVALVTEVLGGDENAAAYAEIVVPQSPELDLQTALAFQEDPWQEN